MTLDDCATTERLDAFSIRHRSAGIISFSGRLSATKAIEYLYHLYSNALKAALFLMALTRAGFHTAAHAPDWLVNAAMR